MEESDCEDFGHEWTFEFFTYATGELWEREYCKYCGEDRENA